MMKNMIFRSCVSPLPAIGILSILSCVSLAQAKVMTWSVDGVKRRAIVVEPSKKAANGKSPVVLSFHGHGDNMENFSGVDIEGYWPEAIVVYPQGLPSSRDGSNSSDGLDGWQIRGGQYGDRDLKLVDAILADLREKYHVDDARIYSTGFSNGAIFSFLLWAERPKTFAAFAPVAGRIDASVHLSEPKPVLQIAGTQDENIPFENQKAAMEMARQENGATGPGQRCGAGCVVFMSTKNAPVMTVIHGGGHIYPGGTSQMIVKFFKDHPPAQ
jgi:polyhydroxybutyrate depolymerase